MNTTLALPPLAYDAFGPFEGPVYHKTFREPEWQTYCGSIAVSYATALGFVLDPDWPANDYALRRWCKSHKPQYKGNWQLETYAAAPLRGLMASGLMVTYVPACHVAFNFRLRMNGDFYVSLGLNAGMYEEDPEAARIVADFLAKVMTHPAR